MKPIVYRIQRIRDGKSFAIRFITAHQEDKVIFSIQISFHIKEEPAITHQFKMPEVEDPGQLKNEWDFMKDYRNKIGTGEVNIYPHITSIFERGLRLEKITILEVSFQYTKFTLKIFQIRPVDPKSYFSTTPHKNFTQLFWVKCRIPLSDDRDQHQALAAYITDWALASTSAKPHFSYGYIPSMMVALDNHCWFHTDDFRADEWMLYENTSPVAEGGRAFAVGRLWTHNGRLILSSAQESLHRSKFMKSSL